MNDFVKVILVFSAFFAIIIGFRLLLKRFNGFLKGETRNPLIKQSIKEIRQSRTIAVCWGKEEFYEPKDTHYSLLSGHSKGFSAKIIFKENGLIINSILSLTYGIKYTDVESVEFKRLTGIGSMLTPYRISIYLIDGIKKEVHLAVTDRALTFVSNGFKDKLTYL